MFDVEGICELGAIRVRFIVNPQRIANRIKHN